MIRHKVYRKIASLSKNGRQRKAAYKQVAEAFREVHRNDTCEFPGCTRKKWEIHHMRGRLGMLLVNHRFFKRLCAVHHDFVHSHPNDARAMGLLAQPGEWNNQEVAA